MIEKWQFVQEYDKEGYHVKAICTLRSRYRGIRRALLVWLSLRANWVIKWVASTYGFTSGGRCCPCTCMMWIFFYFRFLLDLCKWGVMISRWKCVVGGLVNETYTNENLCASDDLWSLIPVKVFISSKHCDNSRPFNVNVTKYICTKRTKRMVQNHRGACILQYIMTCKCCLSENWVRWQWSWWSHITTELTWMRRLCITLWWWPCHRLIKVWLWTRRRWITGSSTLLTRIRSTVAIHWRTTRTGWWKWVLRVWWSCWKCCKRLTLKFLSSYLISSVECKCCWCSFSGKSSFLF